MVVEAAPTSRPPTKGSVFHAFHASIPHLFFNSHAPSFLPCTPSSWQAVLVIRRSARGTRRILSLWVGVPGHSSLHIPPRAQYAPTTKDQRPRR